jgi:PKD repeat protein
LLASTVTGQDGEYYFTGIGHINEAWIATAGHDSINPFTQYKIVFGKNANLNQFNVTTSKLIVNGVKYHLTVPNVGIGWHKDWNDSDATIADAPNTAWDGFPTIMLTTGMAGCTDHTFDAGFVAETTLELVECVMVPNGTEAQFILTEANTLVDPSGTATVTYHATTQDAQTGNGILSSPYVAENDDVVYARVANGTQFNVFAIQLKVAELPVAHFTELKGCPQVFDGPTSVFNLQSVDSQVLNGQAGMTVTYHETQNDAEAGLNAVNPSSYVSTSKPLYVRVANAAGCYDVDMVQLVVASSPGVVLNATDNTCSGAAQGKITATMYDGPANYSYNWSTGTAQGPLSGNTTTLNSLNAGMYTVTVTDGNGCTATSSVEVVDGMPFNIIPIPNYEVEAGSELGPIVLQTSTWGANFTWSGGSVVGLVDGNTTSMMPLIPVFDVKNGSVTVTVSATLGSCSNTTTFQINAADHMPPTAVCQDVVVQLDNNGNVSITPSQIDGGSYDSYAATNQLSLSASNLTFNISNLGVNSVILTVTDPSGNSASCTAQVTVQDVQLAAPIAAMNIVQTQSCMAPFEVQFYDASVGNPTAWYWTFPGGVPSTSTEQNPTVTYAQPGYYLTQLVAVNAAGESELITEHRVEYSVPQAAFSFELQGTDGAVSFTNESENATMVHWSFGDGTESNVTDPVHYYAQAGTYMVELMVTNGCGVEIVQQVVTVTFGSVGTEEGEWLKDFRLYPNPNPGVFTVEMTGAAQDEVEFVLFDALGQMVKRETADFHGGDLKQVFNYGDLPPAVYTLGIYSGKETVFVKVVVQR